MHYAPDEMYVLSATNKKVSIELLGIDKIQNKLSRFEELTSVSLAYLGVSSAGPPGHINTTIPSKYVFLQVLTFPNCT